ncbi:MAG: phosphatidylglycerol lysyltransferase domain-containing protein, partial [Psychromonas sp.]|nr:phosphatidylglycerol lysyltransferase domain-containing protein [Psychromonas sp.]
VFYQISKKWLPLYIDMGMGLLKLGEDAVVLLSDFNLEGRKHAELRNIISKGRRNGLSFEVVPSSDVSDIMPQLKDISDEWIRSKNTREKCFSLGFFKPDYLAQFPCAVIKHNNEIIAFANLWFSANKQEASIDLMRYKSDIPKGVMDYLFVELILWSKSLGYQCFNLGMSPLSGMERHRLAPVWHQIGNLMFQHGEYFYNFEGLRHYKEKFNPLWQPRYLAVKGKFYAPRALMDSALLISGGLKGMVSK